MAKKGHIRARRRKSAAPKAASKRVTARLAAKTTDRDAKAGWPKQKALAPREGTVAIVAMGYSIADYINACMSAGSPHRVADFIIAINSAALTVRCDMAIMMDDVRKFEAPEEVRIAPWAQEMPKWCRTADVPILTARKIKEFPTSVEYPLVDVTTELRTTWFNNSVAYAVAYANVIKRAQTIKIFGSDFYKKSVAVENQGGWEHGMACVVHHLTLFHADGGVVRPAPSSVLMDAGLETSGMYYGYDEQPFMTMHRGKPVALFGEEAKALAARKKKKALREQRRAAKGAQP